MTVEKNNLKEKARRAAKCFDNNKFEESFKLYQELADVKNDPYSQALVGWMYYSGTGISQNLEFANEYYSKAANQGNAEAQYFLGRMALKRKNFLLAEEWFKKSFNRYQELVEETENDDYQTFLGQMYFSGTGTDASIQLAKRYFLKAAKQNNSEAQYYLGRLETNQKNYNSAFKWFNKSASLGYPPSLFRLGILYSENKFIPRNKDLALDLFKKAWDAGHIPSQIKYAVLLIKGWHGLKGIISGVKLMLISLREVIATMDDDSKSERYLR